jgi:adenylate cyclase
MGVDEVAPLHALKAHQREVVDPAIAAHNGRIVKTTGDGMLVEFAIAVDAVNCVKTIERHVLQDGGSELDALAALVPGWAWARRVCRKLQ